MLCDWDAPKVFYLYHHVVPDPDECGEITKVLVFVIYQIHLIINAIIECICMDHVENSVSMHLHVAL